MLDKWVWHYCPCSPDVQWKSIDFAHDAQWALLIPHKSINADDEARPTSTSVTRVILLDIHWLGYPPTCETLPISYLQYLQQFCCNSNIFWMFKYGGVFKVWDPKVIVFKTPPLGNCWKHFLSFSLFISQSTDSPLPLALWCHKKGVFMDVIPSVNFIKETVSFLVFFCSLFRS